MALPIELLETSFQTIAPRGEAFVTAFHEGVCAIMLEGTDEQQAA